MTPSGDATGGPPRPWVAPTVLGAVGSVLLLVGALGAAAGAVSDPIMSDGPLTWMRYGHGKMLATVAVYAGYVLMVVGWVRLGRVVIAGRAGTRAVLLAAACWTVPLLAAPALFTRDVYSYLAQGAIALAGLDPFTAAPTVLADVPLASLGFVESRPLTQTGDVVRGVDARTRGHVEEQADEGGDRRRRR